MRKLEPRSEATLLSGFYRNALSRLTLPGLVRSQDVKSNGQVPPNAPFQSGNESPLLSSLNISLTLKFPEVSQSHSPTAPPPSPLHKGSYLERANLTASHSFLPFLSSFLSIKASSDRLFQTVIILFHAFDSWVKVKPIKILKWNHCNFVFWQWVLIKVYYAAMECWFNSNNAINLQVGPKEGKRL